jgi:hypothetical protein
VPRVGQAAQGGTAKSEILAHLIIGGCTPSAGLLAKELDRITAHERMIGVDAVGQVFGVPTARRSCVHLKSTKKYAVVVFHAIHSRSNLYAARPPQAISRSKTLRYQNVRRPRVHHVSDSPKLDATKKDNTGTAPFGIRATTSR